MEVAGYVGRAVIGGQHDQGVAKPDLLVDVLQKLGKRPVKAQEIVFENDFCSDLHLVEADSSQLQQVFLNILINATEAMPNGGTISTITRMDGDDHVWIEISDTGKGIVPAKADKIFDPFFTTKTRGTGLGLAICRRLVEQHGGTIEVQSTLGEGTSIVICLPLAQQNKEGGA